MKPTCFLLHAQTVSWEDPNVLFSFKWRHCDASINIHFPKHVRGRSGPPPGSHTGGKRLLLSSCPPVSLYRSVLYCCRGHNVLSTVQWYEAVRVAEGAETLDKGDTALLYPLKPNGHYMYRQFNVRQLYVLPTHCIYVFCVDLRTNSDYFPIQH